MTSSHSIRQHHPAWSKNVVALVALMLSTLLLMLAVRMAHADGGVAMGLEAALGL